MSRFDNELLLVDRGWRFDKAGSLWVFPRNTRTLTAKKVKGLEHEQFRKIVFLVERGFVFTGKKWVRGSVTVASDTMALALTDFIGAVRKQQREDGGDRWSSRILPG